MMAAVRFCDFGNGWRPRFSKWLGVEFQWRLIFLLGRRVVGGGVGDGSWLGLVEV